MQLHGSARPRPGDSSKIQIIDIGGRIAQVPAIQHIEEVLQKLASAGIYSKLGKCQFGVSEIKFLGHIVSKEGIKADTEKIRNQKGNKTGNLEYQGASELK